MGEKLVGKVAGQELVAAAGGGGGGRASLSRSRLPQLGFSRDRERLGLLRLGGQQLALTLLALAESDTRRLKLLAQRHIDGYASPLATSARC